MIQKLQQVHSLNIVSKYWRHIQQGSKTVEGRIYDGVCAKIQSNDFIQFCMNEQPTRSLTCKVLKVHKFKSFESMLKTMGTKNCLPDIESIEEGIKIYRSFPSYATKEKTHGVVAFSIVHLPHPKLK